LKGFIVIQTYAYIRGLPHKRKWNHVTEGFVTNVSYNSIV